LWKTIENSNNPDDFDAYLKQYPNGAFAPLANARLEKPAWARIQNSTNPDDFAAFLRRFPYADQALTARARMEKLQEERASLPPRAASLKLIESKIGSEAHIRTVIVQSGAKASASSFAARWAYDLDEVKAQDCTLSYRETDSSELIRNESHLSSQAKKNPPTQEDVTIALSEVISISVRSGNEIQAERLAKDPKLSGSRITVSPDLFSVVVAVRDGWPHSICFENENTAHIVANAMAAVVEQCGGRPR
jgi:hypothetical protein